MSVDPYSTHIGVAAACALASRGPILELGAGFYSTPLLHAICLMCGRNLVTVDSDSRWLERFGRYAGPHHLLEVSNQPSDWAARLRWGFALIDNGQHERACCLSALAKNAELIAAHDTQAPQESYGYEPTLSGFTHRFDYRAEELRSGRGLVPWTTVVSNCRELAWLEGLFT